MRMERSVKRALAWLSFVCASLIVSLPASANTFVHLFEWRWTDVAQECEQFLGPKGFTGVQISPPNEHIGYHTWWARYQPVTYRLESRSGNRQQFIDMVNRCNAAGVAIYADLVVNHTASFGGGGVGSGGTPWTIRTHPMYSFPDYHSDCLVTNYQDAFNVQNCALVGLPDLNTSSGYVQQTIANYANELLSIGVQGFRIDAAKHIAPGEVAGIVNRFSRNAYTYQEVIDLGGEAVRADQYHGNGLVEEFKYSRDISKTFKGGRLADLRNFGEAWGFMPSNKAVVFTDNHDNQRGHGAGGIVLTHKDGSLYDLGNAFMLAWPYGTPRLMSSYDFTDTDAGPPGSPVHGGTLNCFGTAWKCEHRWRPIANMVAFRKTAEGAGVANWWDNGNNQVAFARTGRGFVVINREGGAVNRIFSTTLPAGDYCNIVSGEFDGGTCTGEIITVDASGNARFNVPGMTAAAIHIGATTGCCEPGDPGDYTKTYDQVYFRGTPNGWSTTAMQLVADNTWEAPVAFEPNGRFKFDVHGDWSLNFGDSNNDGTADQSGNDILVSTAGTYTVRFNDSTRAYSAARTDGGDNGTVAVSFTCNNGQTYTGQSVFAVGNHASLGSWGPANGVKLNPDSYPTWTGTVNLPAGAALEWKCVKREEANPGAGIVWEGGANNTVNLPLAGPASTSGSF